MFNKSDVFIIYCLLLINCSYSHIQCSYHIRLDCWDMLTHSNTLRDCSKNMCRDHP